MSIRDLTLWNRERKPSGSEGDYHPVHVLHERMDRLFDDLFPNLNVIPFRRPLENGTFIAPRIDVSESDTAYRFSAELPGVDQKDVEVTLTHGVMTIKGEKKAETKEEADHFLRAERSYGAFQRSFSLPSDIDEGKVKASFKNGVLTVTVAKKPSAKSATKKIEVQSS